jgi:hypothetical protein
MFFSRKPKLLEPDGWSATQRRGRVLVENPDAADRSAHAQILGEAGYEVATCAGPSADDERPSRCPLVEAGSCRLVEGANVVVSTAALGESHAVLAAVRARDPEQPVIFEVPEPAAGAYADVTEGTTLLYFPVTDGMLREAVDAALAPIST